MNLLNILSFSCFVTLVTCMQLSFLPKHGLTPLIKPNARAGPVFLSAMKQPLDHFDLENKREWDMRYMYNGQFFEPNAGGPIFIHLGGEWTISTDFLQGGQMYDMVQQNGAYMFYTEHKFYGNSFPTDTCKPLNTNRPLEVSNFIQTILTPFASLVQYDSCGKVNEVCDVLINASNMDDYTKFVKLFQEAVPKSECIPTYPDLVEIGKNFTIMPGQNGRQWMYQVCFQLGFMQTTSSKDSPFGNTITLDTYHGICTDFFDGHVYNPMVTRQGVDRTNMIYGGLNPNVTRVISVHDKNDPWHKLGLTEDLNPLAPVIIASGASHTFDLASINPCDNEEMIAAKLSVQRYIKEWLNSA